MVFLFFSVIKIPKKILHREEKKLERILALIAVIESTIFAANLPKTESKIAWWWEMFAVFLELTIFDVFLMLAFSFE